MSISFGEQLTNYCCNFHKCGNTPHYSIQDNPKSDIEELKRIINLNSLSVVYVKDEQWIGSYFKKYHIVGWDSQFDMFLLECGSYLDPVGIKWILREIEFISQIFLIPNNDIERNNRRSSISSLLFFGINIVYEEDGYEEDGYEEDEYKEDGRALW